MSLGMLKIKLLMPENTSLKDKRRVLQSVTSQVRRRFNVSISELDDHDRWQVATLGIACVASSTPHVSQTLDRVRELILNSRFGLEVIEQDAELLPGP